jgi:cysteine desulfurase/selenocysteine lyase
VIDRINHYHQNEHANIHRGVYTLSEQATASYENSRSIVAKFLNVADSSQVIFTKGTTHAINLVAHAFGRAFIGEGDEILISHMEHHSNIVPWQQLCEETGAILKVIPITDEGELDFDQYEQLLSDRTKIVAVTHVSNVLGTINPIKEMVSVAHKKNVPVLVDGAQGAPHMKVDVQELDCDFYIFSGHKVCGPTGIGILYGKRELLERMNPYEGGGDMILSVTFEKTTYADIPAKFEAGTPPIAAAIGLGEAINYLESVGLDNIARHEDMLTVKATEALMQIDNLTVYGTAPNKAGVISFNVKGVHPHDMGTLLSDDGVAVRAGHHCAQPVMIRYKVPATTRASFYLYNTLEDIDRLVMSVRGAQKLFN